MTDLRELGRQFTQELVDNCIKMQKQIRVKPRQIYYKINENGGDAVIAAKILLSDNRATEEQATNLEGLARGSKLDLSLEALMLKPTFAPLFSAAERELARQRLYKYNYIAAWDNERPQRPGITESLSKLPNLSEFEAEKASDDAPTMPSFSVIPRQNLQANHVGANEPAAIQKQSVLDTASQVVHQDFHASDENAGELEHNHYQAATPALDQPAHQNFHASEEMNDAIENNPIEVWENIAFESEAQVKIAQALEESGVLFIPNCEARLGLPGHRQNQQADFLICYEGKWGVLEVDDPMQRPHFAAIHRRDRTLRLHGVRVVEHFDADECYADPDGVVGQFLEILRMA